MKKVFLLLVVALLTVSCYNAPEGIQMVNPDEVEKLKAMDSTNLIDVRSQEEFVLGHIEGAKNIPLNDDNFESRITALGKNEPIIVYCKRGGRSAQCAARLQQMGFEKIYDLDGGITKWRSSGKKVVL